MLTSYVDRPRLICLGVLALVAIIEMSMTASRISHTKFYNNTYEGSVAGLLAISILTLIWVPYAAWTQIGRNTLVQRSKSLHDEISFQHQTVGHIILWFLWLVITAVFTGDYPSPRFCPYGNQCGLLAAIQAFGWIAFVLFSIVNVMLLVHMMIYLDRVPFGRQNAPINRNNP